MRPLSANANVFTVRNPSAAVGFSPELELCFLCARMSLGARASRQLTALLEEPVEWDALLATARQHRVVPLVYRTLTALESDVLPPTVASELQGEVRANSRRNLFLTGELLRVIDTLGAHDIPVIPYKGPVLATAIYGDLSLRQFGDLDIIVRSEHVARASELLIARGYQVAFDFTGKDVALFHPKLGVTLEMHWSISAERHAVQPPPERLWENLRPCSVGGRSVLAHAPEDLLWMLCIHGAHHRWERLSWLCDVAEMVRANTLDWDRAVDDAIELAAGRAVFLGLLLSRDLLGAELPARALRAIESDRPLQLLATQVKRWLADPSPDALRPGDAEHYFVTLGERLGDRLRIAFKQVTPYLAPTAREKQELRFPPYLSWLHYVLRPIKLTRSYGLTPLRRLLKGLFQS